MGIFSKVVNNQVQNAAGEFKSSNTPLPWFQNLFGLGKNGVKVSERTALSLSAYYSGINIIANHIASLPIDVLVRDKNGNTIDTEHSLNEILKHQANPYLSATHFKKLLIVNCLVYGNGFARIERTGNKIDGIYIEKPSDVSIFHNKLSGARYYEIEGRDKRYMPSDMIHIFDFTLDGVKGLSVLEAGAMDAFKGHIATQKFSKKYFENNAHVGGVLMTEDSLGMDDKTINEAKSAIREEFDNVYLGSNNWFRTAILDGKWSYKPLDIKASDAMLIERSLATVEDVSRWLQIPLSYLNHTDSQSYKSKEQEAKSYLTNCLNPRIKIFENEIRNKLFLEEEKSEGYKVAIDTKQLVRASLKDTGEFLSQMIDRSIFSINEARDFIDMDTEQGLDIRMQQMNMKQLGEEITDNQ